VRTVRRAFEPGSRGLAPVRSQLRSGPRSVRLTLILISLAIELGPMQAAGQNLVQNGSFASDLSIWQFVGPQGGSALWSPTDVATSSSSGSALLTNDQPCVPQGDGSFACPFPGLSQCVGVVGGNSFSIGFSALIPAGQSVSGFAFLSFQWYSGDTCDAGGSGGPQFSLVSPVGAWGDQVRGAIAPVTARSARVQISAVRDEVFTQGSFRVHFDNVFVNGPGPAPAEIPTLSAPALGVLFLLLAIAGSALTNRAGHF
jgi:hypothetical protein